MPATFTNVTDEQMDALLTPLGFRQIDLNNTTELVYGKRVDTNGMMLTLRVYTTINPNGQSRQKGEDAIRVVLFFKNDHDKIIKLGGSKPVHRTQGWRKNLTQRLDGWKDYLPKKVCSCGMPMIERKGKNGTFLGCTGFPTCRLTQPV